MIEFLNRPFLDYLVEMLAEQGIERILMLLGYMPGAIQSHFGDGRRWGVSIEYAVSPEEDDTGRRLKRAAGRLDPIFLLLYCDNYWPLDLERLWRSYREKGAPAQITAYRNDDGYTRGNLRLSADGLVREYDKSRTAVGLGAVDIGFALLERALIEGLPNENVSFEACVYPALAAQGRLAAFETDHRYYSVGSHERLPFTQEFLARRPTVLLDRDGVLNQRMAKGTYVRTWAEWTWLPGVLDSLRLLKQAGIRPIVITNQPGIARDMMSEADLDTIHERMRADVRATGGDIAAVYYCPHGWDEGCGCRKPRPGLLFQAQRDFHLDLSRVPMIGDDERDIEAARAAGCRPILVSDARPLAQVVPQLLDREPRQWANAS